VLDDEVVVIGLDVVEVVVPAVTDWVVEAIVEVVVAAFVVFVVVGVVGVGVGYCWLLLLVVDVLGFVSDIGFGAEVVG